MFIKYKNCYTKSLCGNNVLRGLKFFRKIFLCKFYQSGFFYNNFYNNFYVMCYQVLKFPPKEVMIVNTIYGFKKALLSVDFCYPGSLLYYNSQSSNKLLLTQLTTIEFIPLGGIISQLFGKFFNKSVFVKSSGCKAIKNREKSKAKLVGVIMPSKILKYFKLSTICVYSSIVNFFLNKFVDGKWGNSYKYKKRIIVRGVAMNPVDHPNGGRTKAKQTELSP
jgi:ribosomal protein L2